MRILSGTHSILPSSDISLMKNYPQQFVTALVDGIKPEQLKAQNIDLYIIGCGSYSAAKPYKGRLSVPTLMRVLLSCRKHRFVELSFSNLFGARKGSICSFRFNVSIHLPLFSHFLTFTAAVQTKNSGPRKYKSFVCDQKLHERSYRFSIQSVRVLHRPN